MELKLCEDKVTDKLNINTKIAEHQEEYQTLHCNYEKGVVAFAFELDEESLKNIQEGKRVYVLLETFGNPMQPINVSVNQESFDEMVEHTRENHQKDQEAK